MLSASHCGLRQRARTAPHEIIADKQPPDPAPVPERGQYLREVLFRRAVQVESAAGKHQVARFQRGWHGRR